MSNPEIFKFFPEPIFKFKFENFNKYNDELESYIYKLQEDDKIGLIKSNKGGWHSSDFALREVDSIQHKFAMEMQKYILKSFQNFGWKTEKQNIRIREMWAIINKKNDFNVVHTHPNSVLSAAYYVKATKNCGRFQIENPNDAKRHLYPEVANKNELNMVVGGIDVNEGDLIIFPGYLPHKVAKNESDTDRIVISFNVDIK